MKSRRYQHQASADFWADPMNCPWPQDELRAAVALLDRYGVLRYRAETLRDIATGGCRCDDIPFGDGTPWCPVHDDGRMGARRSATGTAEQDEKP